MGHIRTFRFAKKSGSRLVGVLRKFTFDRPWLSGSTVMLALITVFFLIPEINRSVVKIEVISSAKPINEAGFSEAFINNKILAAIQTLDNDIGDVGGSKGKGKPAFRGADEKELPTFELPMAKFSSKAAIAWLREWFNNRPTSITVTVSMSGDTVHADVHTWIPDSIETQIDFERKLDQMDQLLQSVAQEILRRVDPARLALRLSDTREQREEAIEILRECVERLALEQKARCLTAWGDIFFDESDVGQAEAKYREALAWMPDWAPAYSGLGSVEQEYGNLVKAASLLKEAVRLDPSFRGARLNLSGVLRSSTDLHAAEREARAAVVSGSQGADALATLGELRFLLRQDAAAEQAFTQAVQRDPGRPSIYSSWGRSLMNVGRLAEGNAKFELALKLKEAGRKNIYNDWGNAWSAVGNAVEAADKHRKAIELNPGDAWFHTNYGDDLATLGRYDEAQVEYAEALRINPKAWNASSRAARVLAFQGRFQEAIDSWRSTAQRMPNAAGLYVDWANALFDHGDAAQALELLHKARQLAPGEYWIASNLAGVLAAQGRYRDADDSYRAAMALYPRSADVLAAWGTMAWIQGQPQKAVERWNEASMLNPSRLEPHNEWGNALVAMGQFDAAAEKHAKAIQVAPWSDVLHVNLADDLIEIGRIDDAIVEYKRAAELSPRWHRPLSRWAAALMRRGELDKANALWTQAVNVDPQAAEPHAAWATALWSRYDFEAAVQHYRLAIEREPWNAGLHADFGDLLQDLARAQEAANEYAIAARFAVRPADMLTRSGRLLARQGKLRAAEQNWKEALRLEPTLAFAWDEWANALRDTGNVDEAETKHRHAVAIAPWSQSLRLAWASDLAQLGRYGEALAQYERANQLGTKSVQALSMWGRHLARGGRWPAAQQKWQAARDIDRDSPVPYTTEADGRYEAREYEAAKQLYEQAIARAPWDPYLRMALADTLAALDNVNAAAQAYADVLKRSGQPWVVVQRWGSMYASRQLPEKAEERYLEAIRLNAAWHVPYVNLGDSLRLRDPRNESRAALARHRQAIDRAPELAWPHAGAGFDLIELHQRDEAVKELQRALALNPRESGVHRALAFLHLTRGSYAKAERTWKQALRLQVDEVDVYLQWGDELMARGLARAAAGKYLKASRIPGADLQAIALRLRDARDLIERVVPMAPDDALYPPAGRADVAPAPSLPAPDLGH